MNTQKMANLLFECLGSINDVRRAQGRRHYLPHILLIIIMAIMTGARGERSIDRFVQNNKEDLID